MLGAIYLDGGYAACRRCIESLFIDELSKVSVEDAVKDAKTELQEWLQARNCPLPVYRTVEVSGAPHEQHFVVECDIGGLDAATRGEGKSRRVAEQQAAAAAMSALRNASSR